MKVLVIEDEKKVRIFVQQALQDAGMVVDAISSPSDLVTTLETAHYDVLVLDRLMEGRDLLKTLPEIRRRVPDLKILVLSALSEVEERVRGLTDGADDYLGKPFHISELVARLRTLVRREPTGAMKGTNLVYEDLVIDLEKQRVVRKDKLLPLTGKEFRLLCLLARNSGRVFSRAQILDQVWDMNHDPESNVVEVTVANLRSKIDRGFSPLIHSRRGVGYWLGKEE